MRLISADRQQTSSFGICFLMARTNQKNQMLVAIGLMSGTSMDAIDVALVRTNGKRRVERGPFHSYPYDSSVRKQFLEALEIAREIRKHDERPKRLAEIESHITELHGHAVEKFLTSNNLRLSDVDIIGFHGQTVLHKPESRLTVQLGDGQELARMTGLPVIYDLRQNDIKHGGQGAPLVPVYHRALSGNLPAEHADKWPKAFVNIGGIANITWIDAEGNMVAFDTGPGNALIDQWVTMHAGIPYDQDGLISAEGRVIDSLAGQYLDLDYFSKSVPKSLDRNDFLPPEPERASLEDGARTLAHVTAAGIFKAVEHLAEPPALWIFCGGGAHNPTILQEFSKLIEAGGNTAVMDQKILTADQLGLNGDAIEAEAWAYLAVRSLRKLKITWPGTTGTAKAVSGGVLALPKINF
jgi:anhydro-N-acetylmuramic acid kinase